MGGIDLCMLQFKKLEMVFVKLDQPLLLHPAKFF